MRTWLFPLWVIVDILVLVSSLSLWIAAPEYTSLHLGLSVFGCSLGVLLVGMKWKEIVSYMKTAYFKKILVHSMNAFLVISIIGLLNYLGNKNFKEFDLTFQKRNTLTAQTLKVMELIKAPIKFNVFSKREEWRGVLNVLKLYKAQNSKIGIEAIDTDVRPDLVKKFSITQNNTVVVEYKEKKVSFLITDELSITNALLKILRDQEIIFYMTTGHQELQCSDESESGLSALCQSIRSQNYQIRTLDLANSDVPKDASAVLVLGPSMGLLDQEVKKLKDYTSKGGNLFLALGPNFQGDIHANLAALAKEYQLVLGKDIVIDNLSTIQGAEATIPIVTNYDTKHVITEGFTHRTIFPLCSSVSLIDNKETAQILAFTSSFPGSWAETDLKAVIEGKAKFEEKSDHKGPIGLIGVSEKEISQGLISHLVLLGSSSFLINSYQAQSGNSTLFLNALSWISHDEEIISFNRPGLTEYPVILSEQHMQMIFVIAILLVPLVFFGTAVIIYRRRRIL